MRRLLRFLPRAVRERLVRAQLGIDEAEVKGLTVKLATTVDEYEQAGRLVHDAYLRRGIIEPQSGGVWVTAHGLLHSTIVFVALRDEVVIGTISLVVDSAVGLPMDKIYANDLAPLRATGRRIAEVGALCVAREHRGGGIALLLNKIMWRCAQDVLHVQDLVIAVHPDAACQYEAVMRFVAIGREKSYPGLTASALAVPLRLDLERLEEVLARDFGALGADPRSPYFLYFVRRDPELQVPTAETLRQVFSTVRRRAAERLGSLRPQCFQDLDTPQRRLLRPMFPTFAEELRSTVTLFAETD